MNPKERLQAKLQDKTAHMVVLGLGYVGLPLATVFAEAGFQVTGVDPDTRKIDALSQGISYIQDVPAGTWYITGFFDNTFSVDTGDISAGTLYPTVPNLVKSGDGYPWCPQVIVEGAGTESTEFEFNDLFYGN